MAAEESEKRFEAILEKLFHETKTSKSKPPSNANIDIDSSTSTATSSSSRSNSQGVHWLKGKKQPNVSSALAIVGEKSRGNQIEELQISSGSSGSVQAPLCRPWERDDLFRRLATFKSMTWFAKPKAVSAVNCARRGWINIDMDIIACESCGARLLFSTPSSWTQQQVEKVALVFSLKLDNGHKLLCPWVNNICDENLAQFPPKLTAVLAEDYKKRCSALLQLSALPVISPSAIDYIKTPQLEGFLGGPSGVEKNKSAGACRSLTNEFHSATSALYYQAQKLISLFGWEPHLLPYIVDSKVRKEESSENVNFASQSYKASDEFNLSVLCSSFANGNSEADNDSHVSERALSEPNSVVFNCRLCGASVGLWAFSSIPRPIEFLRLVGYTEVNGEKDSAQPKDDAPGTSFSGNENRNDRIEGLNTGFAASTSSNEKTSSLNLTIAGGPPPAKQCYRATISLPVIGHNLRARFSTNSIVGKDQEMLLAEGNIKQQGSNQFGEPDPNNENQVPNMQVVAGVLGNHDKLVENVVSAVTVDSVVGDCNRSQNGEFSCLNVEEIAATVKGRACENNAGMVVEAQAANCKHEDLPGDRQSENAVQSGVQAVGDNIARSSLRRNPEQVSLHKSMELDPIRQHRLFCPWITSSGNSAPGWQQTLSALQRHKEFSDSLPENTPPSLIKFFASPYTEAEDAEHLKELVSIIARLCWYYRIQDGKPSCLVDDPIASVRKIFSSPPAKRTKHAHAADA